MLNRHPAIAICRATDFYHYVYLRRKSFGGLSDSGNRQRLVKRSRQLVNEENAKERFRNRSLTSSPPG